MKTCPSCGRREEDSKTPFVGAFCADCFTDRHRLYELRKPIVLLQCQKCGRVNISGQWVEPVTKTMSAFLASKIKSPYPVRLASYETEDNGKSGIMAIALAEFDLEDYGAFVRKTVRMAVDIDKVSCQECSQRNGGYYEAIVQLRGDPGRVERAAQKIGRMVSAGSFVSKIEVLKEGIDVYCGSARTATDAMGKLGWKYSQASKQAGVRNGRNIYRRSYCVRFEPPQQPQEAIQE